MLRPRQSPLLLILALAAMLSGCSLDQKFIFPGSATQGRPYAVVPPRGDYQLLTLRLADGTKIAAQFGTALEANGRPAANASGRPTVIFFYGNGSCLAYSALQFDRFRRLGANVLIPDFPGYGMSTGKPSEEGCYAAADAAYAYLLSRKDIDPARIVAAGWSMGGGVAIDLASRHRVSGLITVSAFTSMPAVAHTVAPWAPTSLLLRSRFDNLTKLPRVTCPIFLAHGTIDSLVPFSMNEELALVAKSPVTRFPIVGGNHNDVFDIGGNSLWQAIGKFLAEGRAGYP